METLIDSGSLESLLYRVATNFLHDDAIFPSSETTVTRLKIGEKSYFDLIFPLRLSRKRNARREGNEATKSARRVTKDDEKERNEEGVRNDYLSFKTNSQVSAKSSANQRVEGGRTMERGTRATREGRCRGR